jgi:glycerol kinase
MDKQYVMAFDSGTTSIRAILFDRAGRVTAAASEELPQVYPHPGWVEHDPQEIWQRQLAVAGRVMEKAGASPADIAGIGITNQRETTVVWERETGRPIMNAIVWQDRRTAGLCDELKARGLEDYVQRTTGLVIDAYFSGTKLRWILDHVPEAQARAERGELLFGTVDTWLVWNLTGGAAHITDCTNASRTMFYDINRNTWDEKLLTELNIPKTLLPEVHPTSEVYGQTAPDVPFGAGIPIGAVVGDQQGALFGQACYEPGAVKATYGTSGSLVMNTGSRPVRSSAGLLTIVAWDLDGHVEYGLEGVLFIAGAAVQWLRDELGIIERSGDAETAALRVADTHGVYFVPAFTGLGAPFWDQYARGTIVGLTRGTNRDHLIRAALESIAYQFRDIVDSFARDSGIAPPEIKVDGGAVGNDFLMQFQADILGVPVLRPEVTESASRGAAFLAGLATGFWKGRQELVDSWRLDRRFEPSMDTAAGDALYEGWRRAVERSLDWERHDDADGHDQGGIDVE